MNVLRAFATICWVLGALLSALFAMRYGFSDGYQPYHAAVAGDWRTQPEGVRTVMTGFMRIMAGGFAAASAAFALTVAPMRRGEPWAIATAAAAGLAILVPTTYWTAQYAITHGAPAPLWPIVSGTAMLVVGVACAIVSARRRPARPAAKGA